MMMLIYGGLFLATAVKLESYPTQPYSNLTSHDTSEYDTL